MAMLYIIANAIADKESGDINTPLHAEGKLYN